MLCHSKEDFSHKILLTSSAQGPLRCKCKPHLGCLFSAVPDRRDVYHTKTCQEALYFFIKVPSRITNRIQFLVKLKGKSRSLDIVRYFKNLVL